MEELTKSQKSRVAIRSFKTIADALALRGYYKPSGRSGQTLADALKMLSPEIYGSMNDPRIIELKGLEYVIDRLPRGVEECTRIVLTAQEDLDDTSFEEIFPLKRRRTSYRLSEKEMCFVITRGLTEIYDVLTHLTFLNIEAQKIKCQIKNQDGKVYQEWKQLEEHANRTDELSGSELDHAVWNLSMILGRTYQETRNTYEYLEKNRRESNSNAGLFRIVHRLGKRVQEEETRDNMMLLYFTPSLRHMIGHHEYGKKWAEEVKKKLARLGLMNRPLHIISANLHSMVNLLYGFGAVKTDGKKIAGKDLYKFFEEIRHKEEVVLDYAGKHGLHQAPDASGTHIDCQIIDTARLESVDFHPDLHFDMARVKEEKPVLLVMDYAFGTQAFEVMDELLGPSDHEEPEVCLNVGSISIMGKAGILPGNKGDIMLASAHVIEGAAHNYMVDNDLSRKDFDDSVNVYTGAIVTVLGTSLQNRDLLEHFQTTTWKAVGLEMEGGHYQRAISAAIIRGHISRDVKVRCAYYASDNPLISGQTLASGSMGVEGIRPTYMISKVILEKIVGRRPLEASVC
ncbi:MAG: hypothetical protein GY859_07135 [Desulfobacterales bacterium]|nr:hypothetical protein [Desulfobacterales bacterium]